MPLTPQAKWNDNKVQWYQSRLNNCVERVEVIQKNLEEIRITKDLEVIARLLDIVGNDLHTLGAIVTDNLAKIATDYAGRVEELTREKT